MIKISTIQIGGKERIAAQAPYHPEFPKQAKHLGGRWNGKDELWHFDPRDEASVRDLCRDLFGTDGDTNVMLVDCRITLNHRQDQSVWFASRRVAHRAYRDRPVHLGDNCVVVDGEFSSSGGSRNNPRVDWYRDSITLEVRDVPESLARREQADDPDNVIILSELPSVEPVTVTLSVGAITVLHSLQETLGLPDTDIIQAALLVYQEHICEDEHVTV